MPFWRKLIVLLGMLWLSTTAALAATDVGTTIVNQATLTYIDQESGQLVELKSNTSTILVAPLRQFELLSSNTYVALAGQSVSLAHTLHNTGNVEDRYTLLVENQLADSGDLINLMLYIDSNENGVVDAGEPVVDEELVIVQGESVSLVITGILPVELLGNDEVEIALHASAVDSDLSVQTNTDLITVKPSANLSVDLASPVSCEITSQVGDQFELTISAVNANDTLPDARQVVLDGAPREGVVLEIDLPSGISLVAGEMLDIIAYQGIAMVQTGSAGSGWMRYELWNKSIPVLRFGLLVPIENFAKDEFVSAVVPAVIEGVEQTEKLYIHSGVDFDGDTIRDIVSAPVCVNVVAPGATAAREIRFVEPTVALQIASQPPQFEIDQDFIDAPVYRLSGETGFTEESASVELAAPNPAKPEYQLAINGVFVEMNAVLTAAQTITDGDGAKYVVVMVESALTGDTIQLLLRETKNGSNLYRSIKPILLSEQLRGDGSFCPGGSGGALPISADYENSDDICVLNSAADDTLTTYFVDQLSGERIVDTAVVDPTSRVFDSTSLQGVSGAVVSITIDGVVQKHPISNAELVLTTNIDGRYEIPRLAAGSDYSVHVEPPQNYVFPSTVSADQFSSFSVSEASYGITGTTLTQGGVFSVNEGAATPVLDIPLDPANRDALLLVDKVAESSSIDVGETLSYVITVQNQSGGQVSDVSVIDYPAYGFRYIAGSATFNGERIEDPQRLSTPASALNSDATDQAIIAGLKFELSHIDAKSQGELRYHMRVTAGSTDGSGINRANANALTASGLLLSTPTSAAQVNIQRSGVMSDQAILFGKVYVDSSCDNIQNHGEWPIGGVRLYLQDGTFVVTDEDGQFSLYGLQPGLHVLKLDSQSMPEGLILKPTDTQQAADPESRFVDLSAGDFHRADFAAYCPSQNADVVFAELKERNLNLRDGWLLNEASRFDPDAKAPNIDVRKRADTDGDLSQGMLGFPRANGAGKHTDSNDVLTSDDRLAANLANKQGANAEASNALTKKAQSDSTLLSARSLEKPQMGDPKELVKSITEDQANEGTWLWPRNDLSWDGRFMAVIKAGLDPVLYVNEAAVSGTQIGEQIVNRRERAQLIAWYGVKLTPGLNEVQIRAKDTFGNERVLAEGSFRRPSAGVRLLLRTRQDTLEADGGASTLPIDIVITDANNNPANGVYFVTLRSTGGAFKEKDLQLQEPGMQVRIENGRGRVHLHSTELTGNVQIQARTGALDASLNVVQIAAARPLIGAGLIDIGGQWNRVNQGDDTRANLDDAFENDARVALFLKGRVKNDMHLSLSYDSAKNSNIDVLRDLNPNEHYATYGDSSIRGVEAQSRSKLYMKLEKDRNSIMWGDYLTDNNADHDDLGRVQRTLTGINGVLDNGRTRLQAFAALESATRRTEEIAGNGTAMLYETERAPMVINSEVVERIVRDRDNPGLVIESQNLNRYVDYTIDFETGVLRFADVVPTVDEALNPVFIRISYDLAGGTDEYLVSGVRLLHQFTPQFTAGASLTDDQNPISGYTLFSVNSALQLSLNTKLSATHAYQAHRANNTDADAQRVHIEHAWHGRRDYRTAMTWARASRLFDNPAAGISQAREEWKFEHRQPIGNTVKASVDATHSRSLDQSDTNTTAGVLLEKTFSNWSVKAGGRHVRSFTSTSDLTFNTFIVGAERRFTLFNDRRGSIGFEYEQDVSTSERYRLGLSSKLQLHDHVTAYARYELDQGLSFQSYEISANKNRIFTAGVESDILPSTKLYSEYRMRGNFGGESIETASGIRGRYEIRPNLNISPAIEVIDVAAGSSAEDSIAVSLGVSDKRNPNRKVVAQTELRQTKSSRYYGFRGSVAQRLSVDWTGLVREEFTRQTPDVGELTSRHRFTLGLARRPKRNNTHHALFMANWKVDYGPQDGQDRTSYLLSTHQNRQIADNAILSGRFGSRWSTTEFDSGNVRTHVLMSDLRATFDVHRRWELDIRGGWLGTGGTLDGKYSFGAGLSWIADRNLRLGIRYNVIGFREDDLDEQGYNAQGVRIGLQVKFDEDWFKWLE